MKRDVKYKWGCHSKDEDGLSLSAYLQKMAPLICETVDRMQQCDGDMFISDYQKLIEGSERLRHLTKQGVKGGEK